MVDVAVDRTKATVAVGTSPLEEWPGPGCWNADASKTVNIKNTPTTVVTPNATVGGDERPGDERPAAAPAAPPVASEPARGIREYTIPMMPTMTDATPARDPMIVQGESDTRAPPLRLPLPAIVSRIDANRMVGHVIHRLRGSVNILTCHGHENRARSWCKPSASLLALGLVGDGVGKAIVFKNLETGQQVQLPLRYAPTTVAFAGTSFVYTNSDYSQVTLVPSILAQPMGSYVIQDKQLDGSDFDEFPTLNERLVSWVGPNSWLVFDRKPQRPVKIAIGAHSFDGFISSHYVVATPPLTEAEFDAQHQGLPYHHVM